MGTPRRERRRPPPHPLPPALALALAQLQERRLEIAIDPYGADQWSAAATASEPTLFQGMRASASKLLADSIAPSIAEAMVALAKKLEERDGDDDGR